MSFVWSVCRLCGMVVACVEWLSLVSSACYLYRMYAVDSRVCCLCRVYLYVFFVVCKTLVSGVFRLSRVYVVCIE